MNGLEEKFTRCPKCRSYSIASIPPKIRYPFFSRFVSPYNSYHCRNCGHNFKQLANENVVFSSEQHDTDKKKTIKRIIIGMTGIFLLLTLFFLFVSGRNQEAVFEANSTESSPKSSESQKPIQDKQTVQPEETQPSARGNADDSDRSTSSTNTNSESGQQLTTEDPGLTPQVIEATIDLAGSNRFGVNWVSEPDGLYITRLSEGPLLRAGMKVGDKVSLLNGISIKSDATVLEYRNNLIQGSVSEGFLTVLREDQTLVFKLINSAKKKKSTLTAILLFPKAPLRIRNSAPEEESTNHRWAYNSNSITLTRKADQKIFISGSPDELTPWAVDNILVISNNTISGLKNPVLPETTQLSQEHYRAPLEISDYFPIQKPLEITFSLVDLGIRWGNTDIYLLII